MIDLIVIARLADLGNFSSSHSDDSDDLIRIVTRRPTPFPQSHSHMGVVCIAIVGKENNPLFLKSFGKAADAPGAELQFNFICHTALDVFEEREASSGRMTTDMFLGMLYPTEDYRVYGYVTSTRIKFVCVVDDSDGGGDSAGGIQEVKDVDIKNIFKVLHGLYVEHSANPFRQQGEKIESKKFEAAVSQSVSRHFLPPLARGQHAE